MERLTKVITCPDGTKIYDISNKLCGLDASRAKKTRMILEKLACYEDAEEQGLLMRLPCKVGDAVYRINTGAKEPVITMHVFQLHINHQQKGRTVIKIDVISDDDIGENSYFLKDIGEKIFLTKEEAEAKLKEMI